MSRSPSLFLAYSPHCSHPICPEPFTPVPFVYQVAPSGQLLRGGQGALPAGSVLMIGGEAPASPVGMDWFCRQVLTECHTQQAVGVMANWTVSAAGQQTAQRLATALSQGQRSFWVPEPFAPAVPAASVFLSSQLSGGTLRGRLQEALAQYGDRITLAMECTPWDFSLPCSDGQGTALSLPAMRELFTQHRCRAWFSSDFYCQYFTYQQEEQLHLVLYDNAASVQAKLELAAEMGLSGVLLFWDEVEPFHPPVWPTTQT